MSSPRKPPERQKAVPDRRGAILAAALEGFTEAGFERTTMKDIRERSGASTGSLYHHFATKEAISAELYVDGVLSAQALRLEALRRHRGAEAGIRAFVSAYLRWVARNPKHASLLLNTRHAEYVATAEARLARLNREFDEAVAAWMAPHVAKGVLPDLPTDLSRAVLTGPSEHFARQWLAGATRTGLDRAAREIADLTWRALWGATRR